MFVPKREVIRIIEDRIADMKAALMVVPIDDVKGYRMAVINLENIKHTIERIREA